MDTQGTGANGAGPTPAAVVAVSLLLGGALSLFLSLHFAATIDAFEGFGGLVLCGLTCGLALSALAAWACAGPRSRLGAAAGLSAAGSFAVYFAFWQGLHFSGYLYDTIGPLSPDLGPGIGPVALLAATCLLAAGWKTVTSDRLSRTGKGAILTAGLLSLGALGVTAAGSVGGHLRAFRGRQAHADEAVRSLRRLGLTARWHPRTGLEIWGTPGGRGADPALLVRAVPALRDEPRVRLSFQGTRAGDADLPPLAALRHLEKLDLTDTDVTDAGLGSLKAFPGLRYLRLGRCPITDAGLAQLVEVPTLEAIYLNPSDGDTGRLRVTDEGVLRLKGLKGLRRLQVPRTVSEGAMHELRSSIPGLAVYY